ncbi:MAG: hypothetical protein RLZZ227_171 [Pseudomonadota bacterium]
MTTMSTTQMRQQTRASSATALMRTLVLLPLAALPQLAGAEGAVRTLECTIMQVCDAAGACENAAEPVNFRMAPVSVREDGSGQYQISYRDVEADMEAASYAGPFSWASDSERNTLLASSETQFLWHRLVLESTPQAEIHFLACTLP